MNVRRRTGGESWKRKVKGEENRRGREEKKRRKIDQKGRKSIVYSNI